MRKEAISLLAVLCFCLVGCSTGGALNGELVFDREEDMAFISFYDSTGQEAPVPDDDLQEISRWLKSFSVGEKAGKTLVPGSNSVSVRIEYADGEVITSGLSTVEIGGQIYYMDSANAPEAYLHLPLFRK